MGSKEAVSSRTRTGPMIRVFTLDRERDGTVVEVLIVARGRDREEHRGDRWPATSYNEAREAVRRKNEGLLVGVIGETSPDRTRGGHSLWTGPDGL